MAQKQDNNVGKDGKVDFLFFPPAVLRQIFEEEATIKHDNFILCKTLLPFTLEALYRNVQLFGKQHIALFAASILTRPQLAAAVRHVGVSDAGRPRHPDFEDVWRKDRADLGAGQIGASSACGGFLLKSPQPYDPSSIVVGPGLLKDLFHASSRLGSLSMIGLPLIQVSFSRRFLQTNPFPTLHSLSLTAIRNETFRYAVDRFLFRNLSLLPNLRALDLNPDDGIVVPLSLLNIPSATSLPARSWPLKSLNVTGGAWAGPEVRHLFASFTDALEQVDLQSYYVSPSFAADLALLPPTNLTQLTLALHKGCPVFRGVRQFPILDDVLPSFVNLEHLHLGGNCLTSRFFDFLPAFPRLNCLRFGPHTAIDGQKLIACVNGCDRNELGRRVPASDEEGPTRAAFSSLDRLTLYICHCPPPSKARKDDPSDPPSSSAASSDDDGISVFRTRATSFDIQLTKSHGYVRPGVFSWPDGFSAVQAEELLRAAAKKGVNVQGTVRCTIGMCEATKEHAVDCVGGGS